MTKPSKIATSFICTVLLLVSQLQAAETPREDLQKGFNTPPAEVQPWVYWYWQNSLITREGIRSDLEAMKRVGIGGVILGEISQGTPEGPVKFFSKEWKDLFLYTCQEAARLGIEVNLWNGAGWSVSSGVWIKPEYSMRKLTWSETQVQGGKRIDVTLPLPQVILNVYDEVAVVAFPTPKDAAYRIPDIGALSLTAAEPWGSRKKDVPPRVPAQVPGDAMIPQDQVIDLTKQMTKDGKLSWQAPEGEWTIVRFICTVTGTMGNPAPPSAAGLHADFLDPRGVEHCWEGYTAKLLELVGPLAGKTFISTHVDSWEAGMQNWTNIMPDEFKKRRGYDLISYLPVMTGRVVGSGEISDRYLRDLRQTVTDLVADKYIGRLNELARKAGLRFSLQGYGGMGDNITISSRAMEPWAEFWTHGAHMIDVKSMASAAHIGGGRVVGGEAFTTMPNLVRTLTQHPGILKRQGDEVFSLGVNRMVFHVYSMQPWNHEGFKPGMTTAQWGLHYQRNNTWWDYTVPWHTYISRVQYLLRQGDFVADQCYLIPEDPPRREPNPVRNQYDYDFCAAEHVMKMSVREDGRLVLPSGMSYSLLVLPKTDTLSLPLLKKITELVKAGASIVGEPPQRTPGLTNYPAADTELRALATELWGTEKAGVRSYGKGKVYRGLKPEQVLVQMGIAPDFKGPGGWNWTHRRDGERDIYFVSNQSAKEMTEICEFRVTGKTPSLWNPETGEIKPCALVGQDKATTRVQLSLGPVESAFVIFEPAVGTPAYLRPETVKFVAEAKDGAVVNPGSPVAGNRKPQVFARQDRGGFVMETGASGSLTATAQDGKVYQAKADVPKPLSVAGPWKVTFPKGWGAPESIELADLICWTKHPEEGVRHFSGTAEYRTTFDVPEELLQKDVRLTLDLGQVEVTSRVFVNDKEVGVAWRSPYRLDVTGFVKRGVNTLRVQVANQWANRLIGDAHIPLPDMKKEWPPKWIVNNEPNPTGRYTYWTAGNKEWKSSDALLPSGLIGPVEIQAIKIVDVVPQP